jgi:hypothetical protein
MPYPGGYCLPCNRTRPVDHSFAIEVLRGGLLGPGSELYRYWSYIGYLLGLDERFYQDLHTHAEAEVLLDLLDSTITAPDDNTTTLTEAMLDSYAEQFSAGLLPIDRDTLRDLFTGLVRFFFGDHFAEELHLPQSQSAGMIPLLAAASAQSWQIQRSSPEGAAAARSDFTAQLVALAANPVPDGTAYQQHATGS